MFQKNRILFVWMLLWKKLNNAINLGFLKINRIPVQIIEAIEEFMIFIVLLLVIKKEE